MDARIGATFPSLTALAWGLLIGGIVAVLIGALLLALAFRRGSGQRPGAAADPLVSPAGAPPIPAPRSSAPSSDVWAPPSGTEPRV
jgi:hypothetical protein